MWIDGLNFIETGLESIAACRPPHVPVPKPGPCPKHKTGIVREIKKAVARPAPPPSFSAQVDALPRIEGKQPSSASAAASAAAKATNPLHGLTAGPRSPVYLEQGRQRQRWTPQMGPLPAGAYEYNCTNVVNAWEMRMRGYDVQAAPIDWLDLHGHATGRRYNGINNPLDALFRDAWRLPDGKPHGRSFEGQHWRTFNEIDAEIERDWPEGGRGVITIGKHVFNVTKLNGKARYIEAQSDQTATRNVTSLYKRKYRAHTTGVFGRFQEGKLIRLDDLVPTDGILETVNTAQQAKALALPEAAAAVPA